MKHYLTNIWTWLRGFVWLWDEKRVGGWQPGWGPVRFTFVYLLNVGTHVILSGGAVTTWSRAAWDLRRSGSRWGKVIDRALQALLGDDHGKEAGAVLWGTTPCRPPVRWAVAVGWTLLLAWLGWRALA